MNGVHYNLLELLKTKYVIIPCYQRDYAQGRMNAKSEEVRTLFVNAIKDAIEQKKELSLDYVYGHEKDDKLYLIDGQQRLTTLYIFYLYAYSKGEIKGKDILKKFCYEERSDVAEYIQSVLENKTFDLNKKHQSPTIEGMKTVRKLIEREMQNISCSIDELNNITFSIFSDDKCINDQVFWKINARGKSLTEAEIFKSNVCGHLKKDKQEVLKDDVFSTAFNNMYEKLFNEQSKNDNDRIRKVDNTILKYIKYYFLSLRLNDNENMINIETYTPFESYVKQYEVTSDM